MALFNSRPEFRSQNGGYRRPVPPRNRAVVVNEQAARRKLRAIRCLCYQRHLHVLPVEMIPLAMNDRDHEGPVVEMGCPHPGCTYREGWSIDFHTGQPRRLFWKHVDPPGLR